MFNSRIRPDLKHCTVGELRLFKQLRDAGSISVFRSSECKFCKLDIPQNKEFCSKGCQENDEERRKKLGKKAGKK